MQGERHHITGDYRVTKISWRYIAPHLCTPDRDPTKGQRMDSTTVQLGEPVDFIGVNYRSVGEQVLVRAEKTPMGARPALAWVTAHKYWETSNTLQAAQYVEECRFQVTEVLTSASRQPFWSQCLLCSSASLVGEGLPDFIAYSSRAGGGGWGG